jgi:hypothetical protein
VHDLAVELPAFLNSRNSVGLGPSLNRPGIRGGSLGQVVSPPRQVAP